MPAAVRVSERKNFMLCPRLFHSAEMESAWLLCSAPGHGGRVPHQHHSAMTLGERLRAVRAAKGLKQAPVATECNMHPSRLSRIENGLTEPTFHEVERLARYLELSLEDLRSTTGTASVYLVVREVQG